MLFRSLPLAGLAALSLAAGISLAQPASLTCAATAVPTLVRAEGLSERVGDINFSCYGGQPGATVNGNLTVFLTTNITNRLSGNNALDTVLTIDRGAGPATVNSTPVLQSQNTLVFPGLSFTLSVTGTVNLRLTNLRASANLAPPDTPIQAFTAFNGGTLVSMNTSQLVVARVQRGLLATSLASILCGPQGSPVPDTISFTELINRRTSYSSSRVSEGYADSFQPRQPFTDQGTRIVTRYSGLPPGARLFVPEAIAGSTATRPTSTGDFGRSPAPGIYDPANHSLLLIRVRGTDSNGAGGNLVMLPPAAGSGPSTLDGAGEIDLTNGSGLAVYEVVDSNPAIFENAQLPTFLGLPPTNVTSDIPIGNAISFGPISSVGTAAGTAAPIPRFVAVTPPPDCQAAGDCNAGYLPKLQVSTDHLNYTAASGAGYQLQYVTIRNVGGGVLPFGITLSYKSGSNWIQLSPGPSQAPSTLRIDAHPENLAPGIYEATVTIDGGAIAGKQDIAVVLTVTVPVAVPRIPAIDSVINAATLQSGPVVAGSLATLIGTNLNGKDVAVTFDGIRARTLYVSGRQINLQVPAELAARSTVQAGVTVDGNASALRTISLAGSAPGIFVPGIVNQDGSVNGVEVPALAGSVISIYATGLPENGVVTARIHDRTIATPQYAGPAPGIPGVQQVNIQVPADLPAMTSEVLVCGAAAAGQVEVCSPPVKVTLRR